MIVAGRGGLVAKQIPVSPGLLQQPVAFPASLSHGESHRAVRPPLLDGPDKAAQAFVGEPEVLPALKYKGAKPQLVARLTAAENLLLRQPVALDLAVAFSNAAVIAVVFAKVGKLNQSPDEHPVPIDFPALLLSLAPQEFPNLWVLLFQQAEQLSVLQVVLAGQGFRQAQAGAHGWLSCWRAPPA